MNENYTKGIQKVLKYANTAFGHQKTIDLWHNTMLNTLNKFKEKKKKSY